MEQILKNKLIEVMKELTDLMGKSGDTENQKNFILGKIAMLTELLESEK